MPTPTTPNTDAQPSQSRETIKACLRARLQQAFTVCRPETFAAFLKTHKITLYTRRHQQYPSGVIFQGKKYRFATLNLKHDYQKTLAGWQRLPGFQAALQHRQHDQFRQQWRQETGYPQEIADVLRSPRATTRHTSHDKLRQTIINNRHSRRARYFEGLSRQYPDLPGR